MDGLRAMREARYAENAARAKTSAPTAKQPAAKQAAPEKAAPEKAAPTKAAARASGPASSAPSAETDSELCHHRAISGRTCTREKGHAAKSHRYA